MVDERYFLRGEYDLVNAEEFEADLLTFAHSNGGGPITVDCTHLDFIDSSGIGVLLRVSNALVDERRTLRLVNVPSDARRVVEILSLSDTFGVAESLVADD